MQNLLISRLLKPIRCIALCSVVFIAGASLVQAQQTPASKKTPAATPSKPSAATPPAAARQSLSPEAEQLRSVFMEFINAYSDIEKSQDAAGVLRYMAPEVISTLVNFNKAGKMHIIYSDYRGFAEYLGKLIATKGLDVSYKLRDLDKIYVNENIGIVVYGVDYENTKDKQLWSRGHENVSLTYKKVGGEWKISQYVVTAIEDEKSKVNCDCEIFNDRGEYVMKTIIPNGRTYNTELRPIGVMNPPDAKLIAIGEQYYKWYANGDIKSVEEDKDGAPTERKIGEVGGTDIQAAILAIIQTHFYRDVCHSIKIEVK